MSRPRSFRSRPAGIGRRAFAGACTSWLAARGLSARGLTATTASVQPMRSRATAGALASAPRRIVDLHLALDHPQGLDLDEAGTTFFVSSVHRPRRVGLLAAIDAATGVPRRVVEVQQGSCYHPGGLSRLGTSLWVPVAEYRRASRTIVQERTVAGLEARTSFEVADHIGCLAVSEDAIVGANWDARTFYAWSRAGAEVLRRDNPTAASYQDLKWLDGRLVAGGLLGDAGVIDVLEWPSLALVRRVTVGRTDRGVVLTHEGLAISRDAVWLLPEDDPARVFEFPRPDGV